jgi:thiamine biosynthesis protein ThiS
VRVVVNGTEHHVEAGDTIARLLELLGFTARYALVELNGEPVERSRFAALPLEEGDTLIVARPVAGG